MQTSVVPMDPGQALLLTHYSQLGTQGSVPVIYVLCTIFSQLCLDSASPHVWLSDLRTDELFCTNRVLHCIQR